MSLRDDDVEGFAKALFEQRYTSGKYKWDQVPDFIKEGYRDEVKIFLTLQDSGHRLLIGKVGAELPEIDMPWFDPQEDPRYTYKEGHKDGQQDMLKEGWVKEVKDGG